MNYHEHASMFGCKGDWLLGIVSLPGAVAPGGATSATGVVIIVGGPQYRAGSHRQFVFLARALANAGTPTMRFDYRGMGDGTGGLHTFENVNEDVAAAINFLQTAAPCVRNVVLWGLCDGASAALLYCHATRDERIKGLCLLNPWVRSEVSLAKTQVKHYYAQRLLQSEFWLKLVSGRVTTSAVSGLVRSVKTAFARTALKGIDLENQSYQTRMAQAWMAFKGPILLILSGRDYTAKEFREYVGTHSAWTGALGATSLTQHELPLSDHTFSKLSDRKLVEKKTIDWIANMKLISYDD